MITHDKEFNILNPVETAFDIPSLKESVHECPECRWRTPVKSSQIDWKAECERRDHIYREMSQAFYDTMVEAGEVFNVPLKEWVANQYEHLKMTLEALVRASEQTRGEE